jgi:hypothetical protein
MNLKELNLKFIDHIPSIYEIQTLINALPFLEKLNLELKTQPSGFYKNLHLLFNCSLSGNIRLATEESKKLSRKKGKVHIRFSF